MTQGTQHEAAAETGRAQLPHPEESPGVERLLAVLDAQFGGRLDEAGRERVREQLERMVGGAAALSARALANGDEPDFVFHPYRGA